MKAKAKWIVPPVALLAVALLGFALNLLPIVLLAAVAIASLLDHPTYGGKGKVWNRLRRQEP